MADQKQEQTNVWTIERYFQPRTAKHGKKTIHRGSVVLSNTVNGVVFGTFRLDIRERIEDGTYQVAFYKPYGNGKFDWINTISEQSVANAIVENTKVFCEKAEIPFGEPLNEEATNTNIQFGFAEPKAKAEDKAAVKSNTEAI